MTDHEEAALAAFTALATVALAAAAVIALVGATIWLIA